MHCRNAKKLQEREDWNKTVFEIEKTTALISGLVMSKRER
jgi:hypothetical protein